MKITDLVVKQSLEDAMIKYIDRLDKISEEGPKEDTDMLIVAQCLKWAVLELKFIKEQKEKDKS